MRRPQENRIPVDVRLSFVTSNREPGSYAQIRLTDKQSGLVFAEVDLLPAQLYAVLSSQGTYMHDTEAVIPSAEDLPHIGRKLHTLSRKFTQDYGHFVLQNRTRDQRAGDVPAWRAWAEEARDLLNADSFSWSDRNDGVMIHFQRYSNNLDQEDVVSLQSLLDGLDAPAGLK